MTTLYEGAFAKINLTLDVTGKREDGFHDIKSVMQTVSIRDDVEIDIGTGKPWSIQCCREHVPTQEEADAAGKQLNDMPLTLVPVEGIPNDESNLAWKAAKVFYDAMKKDPDGLSIRILKRIPSGAGLGGGSADAAAVLRALNQHYDSPLSIYALAELGAQVGSDVPFCVIMGTCMVEGRGERIRKMQNMPDCVMVVCKPEFSVSTPELYRKIDEITIPTHPDHLAMESAILAGDIKKVADAVYNVFDPLVTQDHLELNYIKSIMNTYGSLIGSMTGSGSAVFAIAESFEAAIIMCDMLRDRYPQIYLCKPV